MLPRMFLVTALLLPGVALAQDAPEPTTITAADNRNKPNEIGPGRYPAAATLLPGAQQ